MPEEKLQDGIHAMVPRDKMVESARKLRDTYAITPGIPLFKREFGFFGLENWKAQGKFTDESWNTFDYDPGGNIGLGQLGWCEAAFVPAFETKILEDRGEHELVQDYAGRHVLYFKGRRSGFMPEYVDHPVKDMKTWEENVKWRLDIKTEQRYADLDKRMEGVKDGAGKGYMVSQGLIGGYMYLRSLIGPGELPYAFYDMPDVIHDCMKTWFELADAVIEKHQQHVTIDEFFLAEDICYNHGILMSPDMMKEFLTPYYKQLLNNTKARQIDKERHLYVHVDTDGYAVPSIPVYMEEIGLDVMSPFEVASYCDVVEIGKQYPNLTMFGGIDKRVLAKGKKAIDEFLEYVIPPMKARGGYIPTCDHGVPEEVEYDDYVYYRKRCVELGS
jgi:hypothetical protein